MQTAPKCPKCSRLYCARETTKRGGSNQGSASRIPLLLICGHTFCTDCLTKAAKIEKTSIQCMIRTCQQSTSLKTDSSVRSLPANVYIIGLLEAYHVTNPPPVFVKLTEFMKPPHLQMKRPKCKEDMCEECGTAQATCRCMKCMGNMCGTCFSRVHASSNMLRQHQATPLERNVTDLSNVEMESAWPSTCAIHTGRTIEYFCEDDEVAICSYCVIMGDHKNHKITTCGEKNKQCFEELTSLMVEAMTSVKYSKKSYQLLHSMIPSSRTKSRALVDEVQLHFQHLHSLLQAREQAVCEDILAIAQQQLSPIEDLQATLSEHMKNLEAAIIDSRTVVTNNRHAAAERSVYRLRQLISIPCYAVPLEQFSQFECEMDDSISLRDIQCYGRVKGLVIAPIEMKPMAEAPDVVNDSLESSAIVTSLCSAQPCIAGLSVLSSSNNCSSLSKLPLIKQDVGSESDSCSVKSQSDSSVSALSPSLNLPPRQQFVVAAHSKKLRHELVVVSHIQNPCNFVVQLNRNMEKLKNLNQQMNAYCNLVTNANEIPSCVEPGDLVLARYSKDNLWYRARVLKQIDMDPLAGNAMKAIYDVLFIDYGNMETVPFSRMRNIVRKFTKESEFGILCSLVDIVPAGSSTDGLSQWSREAIQAFASMTGSKPITMTIIQESEHLAYVDLSRPPSRDIEDDGPVSLRDSLVFLGLAVFASPHSLPSARAIRRKYLNMELPRPSELREVIVCHIESPSDFYIQMIGEESHYLVDLMSSLQATYSGKEGDIYTVFCPSKGMMCVAQYSADKVWYRAEVIDIISSGQIVVKYVDYGNTEITSVWNLRKLLDVYAVLPVQTLQCGLADVICFGVSWPMEAVQLLQAYMNKGTELVMKVNDAYSDRRLSVFLQDPREKHSINATLVANGFARATGVGWELVPQQVSQYNRASVKDYISASKAPSCLIKASKFSGADSVGLLGVTKEVNQKDNVATGKPFYPEVSVSHVVTPFELYLHDLQRKESLEKMMFELNKHMKNKSPAPDVVWTAGMECVARSLSDKRWYRAVVGDLVVDKLKIVQLDYGVEEELPASELMAVPESFTTAAGFALCCHLADVMPAGDITKWSRTACEMLTSILVKQKKCYVVPKGPAVSGSLPVDLLLEEVIMGSALTSDTIKYNSIVQVLREKGLALPKRKTGVDNIPDLLINKPRLSQQIPSCSLSFSAESQSPAVCSWVDASEVASSLPDSYDVASHVYDDVSKFIPFKPANLPYDVNELVLVMSCVDQYGNIFGHRLQEDLNELKELMREVQIRYADTEPDPGQRWFKNQPAVALFSDDDMFYRVQVLDVLDDGLVEVFYVDFGNTEIVEPSRLRSGAVLLDVPVQAFHCKLYGVKWLTDGELCPPNVLSYMRLLLDNQPCTAYLKNRRQGAGGAVIFEVELILPSGRDIGAQLCDEGLARWWTTDIDYAQDDDAQFENFGPVVKVIEGHEQTIEETELLDLKGELCSTSAVMVSTEASSNYEKLTSERMVPSPFKQMPLAEIGDVLLVVITEIRSPHLVYIQNVRQDDVEDPSWDENAIHMLDKLVELSEIYGDGCQNMAPLTIEQITAGVPCVAQCSVDGCWYRAEVLDVRQLNDGDFEACVFYVDYGSRDVINSCDKLRTIPVEHMDLPAQAIPCRIADIEPAYPESDWSSAVISEFAQIFVSPAYLRALVTNVVDGLPEVELFEESGYGAQGSAAPLLYQSLIDSGQMKLSRSQKVETILTSVSLLKDDEDHGIGTTADSTNWANEVEELQEEN